MHLLIGAAALLAPLQFEEIDLPTGVRLRYAEQGDPSGLPVILLHGYGDSWYSWSRVLPLLASDLRVFALDQRGHGQSSRAARYQLDDMAADVIAFMDALGLERAVLVGHSMGSFVAQRAAVAAPGRVAGLALVGSATQLSRFAGIEELDAAVRQLADPVPVEFIRDFQYSVIHASVPDDFMARVIEESRALDAATWQGLMAGMLATPAASRLGDHGIPTWLVWGERDALATIPERDALGRQVGAHRRTVYRETGHTPQWERPEQFARDLESFIARSGAGTTSRRSR